MRWPKSRDIPAAFGGFMRRSALRGALMALIVAAVAAAYSNSLHNSFIFDDTGEIADNRSIRQLWPLREVFFVSSAGEVGLRNRPVVNFTWAINYAMGGLDTLPYHLTNLAIHVLAALTLFGIVRRTLELPGIPEPLRRKALPVGLAVALVWALHPMQTQAVTYITQRYESLMGLFYLLALYGLIRAGTSVPGRGWAVFSVGAALLAMGSKEVAVSAPLCLLLYDRAFLAGSFRAVWARRQRMYAGLLGAWVGFALLQLLSGTRETWAGYGLPHSWWEYALSQFGVILHYLRLSLWPHPLVLDYGWPVARGVGDILPGALVVGVLVAASVYALARRPRLGFLGAWFFLILAPTSSIFPLADLAFLHRMYLPLAAIVVLAVLGGRVLADTAERRSWLGSRGVDAASALVLALITVALAVGTWQRNRDYATAVSIWRDTIAKAPRNPRAHFGLGAALAARGEADAAIAEYRAALELRPDYAEVHINLGGMFAMRGEEEQAIAHYRAALATNPGHPLAHMNLGSILAARGETDEAIAHYRTALEIDPDFAEAHANLGIALAARGETDEAMIHYRKALEIKPAYPEAHNNLGILLAARGELAEALAHYRTAVDVSPAYAEAHNNLGIVLAARGEVEEAIAEYRKAQELRPDYAEAYNNMGSALAAQGRMDSAIPAFAKALEIRPGFAEARFNLAYAYDLQGNAERALVEYRRTLEVRPDYAEAHFRLGVLLAARGETAAADQHFRRAQEIKPEYAEERRKLEVTGTKP